MLILLPPSEGKAASPRAGRPVDLDRLWAPSLREVRERLLAAVDPAVRAGPALPAARLYNGVLYQALDVATLSAPARRLADRSVLVFSGLFGPVRLRDRLPAYRCPIGSSLPGVGGLAAYWRAALPGVMAEAAGRGPVLDLRSAAYAAAWRPPAALASRVVAVRVLHERVVDGEARRSVVSHFNKATKGRLLRDLLTAGARPRSPAALVEALRDLKYEVEQPSPGVADVIVRHL